jgi:hypothetical protein
MYTLIRSRHVRQLLMLETPSLIISMTIAERLYRFHHFLLESIAFLATWYVIGAMVWTAERAFQLGGARAHERSD